MSSGRRGPVLMMASLVTSVGLFAFGGGSTAEAARVLTFSPLPTKMPAALQGSVCASPNRCDPVPYSALLTTSVNRITEAIAEATSSADEEVIVFGLSGGAGAANEWMKYYADEADAPSAEVLSFLFIGNPGRRYGGMSSRYAPTPETQYRVVDIVQQYDPVADRPDDPFNLLAQMNLAAGLFSPQHTDYTNVDINDPKNIVWTEGNITYILVPTEKIPLLNGLRAFGLNSLADSLNDPLKAIIERGYNRPIPITAPVASTAADPESDAVPADLTEGDDAPNDTGRSSATAVQRAEDVDSDRSGYSTSDGPTDTDSASSEPDGDIALNADNQAPGSTGETDDEVSLAGADVAEADVAEADGAAAESDSESATDASASQGDSGASADTNDSSAGTGAE
ncbi:MAG: PE-PPE domain-containing protein [Mycolicibacterium sp.]|uniref:PE-PPE domain-containing protein n=1 Tax=Mycolicibacterium sp. TaxID=2320850 RepID=UPI003D1524CE